MNYSKRFGLLFPVLVSGSVLNFVGCDRYEYSGPRQVSETITNYYFFMVTLLYFLLTMPRKNSTRIARVIA
jgi:hypothetical protein